MDQYTRACHCVHRLTYHLIFVTKYRKPAISDEMGEYFIRRAAEIMETQLGGLISGESDRDHIHLQIWLPPNCCVSNVVRVLKTQLSKYAHTYFEKEIQQYLHGDIPFWGPNYFVATTGSVSNEVVEKYIESQRTDAHQNKRTHWKKPPCGG